eukprot:UN03482
MPVRLFLVFFKIAIPIHYRDVNGSGFSSVLGSVRRFANRGIRSIFCQFHSEYWNHPDIMKKHLKMRIVAFQILSIPVGVVPCERLFSALKNLIGSNSTNLTPIHTQEKLILGCWKRMKLPIQ